MAFGMLAIAGAWLVALASFAGLGLGLLRCLRLDRGGSENGFASIWIGWALAVGVLKVWQLIFPVNVGARLLLVALGAAGLGGNFRLLATELRPMLGRVIPFAVAAALLALWLANRAMAAEMNSDVGLYHLPTGRWLSEYPVVPGLGNLNWRLAFNSSYFLYWAAMDFGPWAHRVHHVTVYFLLLVLGLQLGWGAYSIALGADRVRLQVLLRLVLVPAVARKMWAGIHEVEPDLAAWVLGVVIVDQLVRMVDDRHDGRPISTSTALVCVAAGALVCVRLSAGLLGLAAMAVALWLQFGARDRSAAELREVRPVSVAVLLSGLLIGVWILRGCLLSGYPAFPLTLGGAKVEWRVPVSVAASEARWIMAWARQPGVPPEVVLNGWGWLRPWMQRLGSIGSFDIVAPLAIGAMSVLAALARRRAWNARDRGLGVVALVPVLSLAFWFLTAPDPRFAGAAAWLLAGCGLLLAFGGTRSAGSPWAMRGILVVAVAAAVAPHLTAPNHISPGPEKGFYALPRAKVEEVTLPSGLTYFRPLVDNQCWDAPLPCAPYPPIDLQLRQPGDIRRGFRVTTGESE
jgi:hypothetical protein